MNCQDLNEGQLDQMGEVVGRFMAYVGRMKSRMESKGFPRNDELWVKTCKAYDAVHGLSVSLHYLSCDAAKRRRNLEWLEEHNRKKNGNG